MPNSLIKSWSKKYEVPKKELETKWDKAGRAAEKQGQEGNYAYQTQIFKNMTKDVREDNMDELQKLRTFIMEQSAILECDEDNDGDDDSDNHDEEAEERMKKVTIPTDSDEEIPDDVEEVDFDDVDSTDEDERGTWEIQPGQ